MPAKPPRRARKSTYSKVSATLETSVLSSIQERTTNVSEFLNEAAKRKLYFEGLREAVEELDRQGVKGDPAFRERFRKAILGGRPSRLTR